MAAIKRYVTTVLGFAAVLLSAQSCDTIWQDRDKCPAVISVATEGLPPSLGILDIWLFDSDGTLAAKDTVATGISGYVKRIKVKRSGRMGCYIWGGIGGNTKSGTGGEESSFLWNTGTATADSLRFFGEEFSAAGDEVAVNPVMHKYFASVDVKFVSVAPDENISIDLTGNSCGYTTAGKVLGGELFQRNICTAAAGCGFVLLRHTDPERLRMNLSFGEGLMEPFEFKLGHYLAEMRYDMESPDMEDITLIFDLAEMKTFIQFGNWTMTVPVEIIF